MPRKKKTAGLPAETDETAAKADSDESLVEDTVESAVSGIEAVKMPNSSASSATDPSKDSESKKPRVVVIGIFANECVMTESTDEAREFYNQSRFGAMIEGGKVQLSLLEALYLMEKGRLSVIESSKKSLSVETFMKKARKVEPNFRIRYGVFKDIRNRGYIIKTALKFGADFRVYDRGVKPGDDHARWIVYPVHEGEQLTWYEFSAKNRVAHSTKKRLLIGVVDDEGDVTYYEIRWVRP